MATVKVRLSKDAPAQKYVDGVTLPVDEKTGRPVPIQPGDVIEVASDIGKALLEQSDKWEEGPKTVPPVNKEP